MISYLRFDNGSLPKYMLCNTVMSNNINAGCSCVKAYTVGVPGALYRKLHLECVCYSALYKMIALCIALREAKKGDLGMSHPSNFVTQSYPVESLFMTRKTSRSSTGTLMYSSKACNESISLEVMIKE